MRRTANFSMEVYYCIRHFALELRALRQTPSCNLTTKKREKSDNIELAQYIPMPNSTIFGSTSPKAHIHTNDGFEVLKNGERSITPIHKRKQYYLFMWMPLPLET